MQRRRGSTIEDLRHAIDCLPVATRIAMLEGIRSSQIMVGAYTDNQGAICPMLAAHRNGGRTSLIAFAHAWDRFARAKRARRATRRELRILESHLEASLLEHDHATDLATAISEHRELAARRAVATPHNTVRSGDPDRSRELRRRAGWAWLRPFRRLDDYERALASLEDAAERSEEPVRELTLC
jgi:hypothetical protein